MSEGLRTTGGFWRETKHGRAVEVHVLGHGFVTRVDDMDVELRLSGQRVVACLAVSERSMTRRSLVGVLWPDIPSASGLARLRNAVWNAKSQNPRLLASTESGVALGQDVVVDLELARSLADDVLRVDDTHHLTTHLELLQHDILSDWDEEWLDVERRSFTVLRLRALERAAHRFLARSSFFEAEQACRAIIAVEPYRESVWLLLAKVHLAEGNAGLALQELARLEELFKQDLGITPNDDIRSLVSSIRAHRVAAWTG